MLQIYVKTNHNERLCLATLAFLCFTMTNVMHHYKARTSKIFIRRFTFALTIRVVRAYALCYAADLCESRSE